MYRPPPLEHVSIAWREIGAFGQIDVHPGLSCSPFLFFFATLQSATLVFRITYLAIHPHSQRHQSTTTMSPSMQHPLYPNLAKPVQIGAILARNGAIMASLTRNRSGPGEKTDSIPNTDNLEYYRQRAAGGAGLILTEGTLISQQGTEWPRCAGLWSQEHASAWKKIVDAVHAEGCPIVLQSWHVGRIAHPEQREAKLSGKPVFAPSAIASRGGKFREIGNKPHTTPTAIPDPKIILEDYKNNAILAKEVGFDGIEVHSANGYLIHQFLDSTTNKRTDQYGGSIENRCRFGLEVTKTMIEVFGADRVGIKLTPCGGYNDVGMPLEEDIATFKYYITELDKMGIAYIQLVRYLEVMDPEYEEGKKRATIHDVVATYTPLIENAKVLLNGSYDAKEADEAIAKGIADAVVFGVPFISNPDFYQRVQLGLELEEGDQKTFYAGKPENNGAGYTDYPFSKDTPAGHKDTMKN